jgi:uncharacterized protein YecE (DUF72 family)
MQEILSQPASASVIAVGTCGYSYADWVGPVYPPGTKPRAMLDFYTRLFRTVEIDATYYRVPSASRFASLERRTPAGFRFTAKLPGTATHAQTSGVHDDVRLFGRNIAPLVEAGKFACALIQFPNSFHPSDAARATISRLRDALPDLALAAEFRHRDWQTPETNVLLRELNIGLVNVDMPHFKTLLRESSDVTSDIAYVRFHGRNAANWWRGTNETRYDYLYEPQELEPWVDRLVDMAAAPKVKEVLAFFNNHRRGQAVRNAELLEDMIESQVPGALRRVPTEDRSPLPIELPLSP